MIAMSTTSNSIVRENALPGDPPTEWDVNGWGDPTIQGFGHDISINPGETIFFKIKTDSADYRIDIYRMGYYGGMGARRVDTLLPSAKLPQRQPEAITDPDTHLYDCGNWAVSASWNAPREATSGIYFARLVRQDSDPTGWRVDNSRSGPAQRPAAAAHAYGALGYGRLANALSEPRASHIYFIVRDDDGGSDILFQTSDTTWQAYNRYGGHCTYGRLDPKRSRSHGGPPRAYKVSYNRPIETRHYRTPNSVLSAEYACVRWLEANGYDVSYFTGVDSDRRGKEILKHRLFLSVGHDEYWSRDQRRHVEAARDAGVNLAFFSGNEVFWKTRWEESIDGSGTPHRTLVTYKETHDDAKIDPVADVWTGTWRDSRPFNPEGAQPENALTGTIFTVNAWRNDPLIVPFEYAALRFWRNTEVANLRVGERAVLLKGLLGHEWDEDLDNGFRPPGLFRLSETTIDNVPYIQDHGSVFDSGTATHHLTLYRHASGALVFGAGTVQWAWGLDAHHDADTGVPTERANSDSTRVGVDPNGPDRDVQQATVNLFADMGIQPATLQSDLVAAAASSDTVPPTSTIMAPANEATLPLGTITIAGRASDERGGHVAAVEVSVDSGITWHPASGRETWSYTWLPERQGRVTISSRAVDDSGNLERPGPGVAITINSEG
ncbi:MAG: Ig-like domain-containing protein [Gammaproteobacteria bacterium]|nr:Ig-like domain-containing protein [Gammaproteobacteria bacterium]